MAVVYGILAFPNSNPDMAARYNFNYDTYVGHRSQENFDAAYPTVED